MRADAFFLLGLEPGADKKEIKRAYRKLAKSLHPDLNKNPEAEARFKKIQQAYEYLMSDGKDKDLVDGGVGDSRPPENWVDREKETFLYMMFGHIIEKMLKEFKEYEEK